MTTNQGRNKPQRLDPMFVTTLRGIMQERVMKGLSKAMPRELSFAEATKLTMKTDGWKKVVEELRTKPKSYAK
jgi:hypothetical protein